jgi:hypothetical protein
MSTAATFRELCASLETESFFLSARPGGRREAVGRGDAEEFDLGDLEGEFLVAFPADVAGCFALDADDAW